VWCANTLQYSPEPVKTLKNLIGFVKPGGKIVVKDEDVIRDIFISWDPEIELEIINAWYKITQDLKDRYWDPFMARKLFGLMRSLNVSNLSTRTYVIERVYPVDEHLRSYITRAFWGYQDSYRFHLPNKVWQKFAAMFNPHSEDYIFQRSDFHFIGTETVVSATID